MVIAITRFFRYISRLIQRLPLVAVLEVPYLLQILTVIILTGWVMVQFGRMTVAELATELRQETLDRVSSYISYQLAPAHQLNEIQVAAVETGLLDLENFDQMGQFFWRQMQVYPVGYINYANQAGEFIGVERLENGTLVINETRRDDLDAMTIYQTDDQGHRTHAQTILASDPVQQEDWYAEAAAVGHPIWTDIYTWDDKPDVLSISASYPLYDSQGQLLGVMGTDVILTQLSQFLESIQVSPSTQIFIMERNGLLVASSANGLPFQVVQEQAQRVPASQSANPVIRKTTEQIIQRFGRLATITQPVSLEFHLNHGRQFVSLAPWQDNRGIDWLVVVVIPEADFMAETQTYLHTTLLLCLLALAIALLMALLTARWINRPIRQLAQASRAIAAGDLNQTVRVRGIRELKVLSDAFNQMANQLANAFNQLENRVQERTAELATAKAAAEAANQAKSQFLANMSHQLRTPLNIILGFIQVMRQDSDLRPNHREALASMHRSGNYLLSQINNLLSASKVDAPGFVATYTWFDLRQLLQNLQAQFYALLLHKPVEFIVDVDAQAPQWIYTDEIKLQQSLFNLLDNALKFTIDGQVVLRVFSQLEDSSPPPEEMASESVLAAYYLSLSRPSSQPRQSYVLTFAVVDTGPGIDPKDVARLFNPFEQTELGQQSQIGSGLGLFISREYVRLLGGTLHCRSVLGQGSCFEFTLRVNGRSGRTSPLAPELSGGLPPDENLPLARSLDLHLEAMPLPWHKQLELAAIKGDDEAVLALTRDIPLEHAPLAEWLCLRALDFQFDAILKLIQEVSHDHS